MAVFLFWIVEGWRAASYSYFAFFGSWFLIKINWWWVFSSSSSFFFCYWKRQIWKLLEGCSEYRVFFVYTQVALVSSKNRDFWAKTRLKRRRLTVRLMKNRRRQWKGFSFFSLSFFLFCLHRVQINARAAAVLFCSKRAQKMRWGRRDSFFSSSFLVPFFNDVI